MPDPNPCRKVPAEYSPISARVTAAQNLRVNRANAQAVTPAAQPCNGDETDFPTYIANFSKSLAHNADGEPMTAAYNAFLAALGEKTVCAWDRHLEDPQVNPTNEQLGTVPVVTTTNSILRFKQRNSSGMPIGPNGARLLFDNPLSSELFSLEGADPQTVGIYDLRPPSTAPTGYTPAIISLPPPPKFSSKTELAEIVENYWMALLRDVPFKYYTAAGRNDDVIRGILSPSLASKIATLVDAAVADLGGSNLVYYYGQNQNGGNNGAVTEQTLFRGFTEGDRIGPYVSQFFVRPVPVGRLTLSPKQKTAAMRTDYGGKPSSEPGKGGRDYLTTKTEWIARQRGFIYRTAIGNVADPNFDVESRLIRAGRDAGEYVHADVVFQEFFNACFILLTPPAPRTNLARDAVYNDLDPTGTVLPYEGGLFDPGQTLAPEIPYQFSQVEKGFITLGNHDLKSMIGEVARRALATVWYYKFNIHRRLRPEEFAGRINQQLLFESGPYPFYALPTSSVTATVLPYVYDANATNPQDPQGDGIQPAPEAGYLLPQQFPEGCPVHPSYGAGHATASGACVTLMKALFNDDLPLANLKFTDPVTGVQSTYFKPVQPSADGRTLEVYAGSDASQMTIASELNKLASNEALFRNLAGVHWRTDYTYSLLLGQAVAIYYLLDIVNTYSEEGTGTDSYANPPAACDSRPPLSFTLRTFEGHRIRIAKSSAAVPAGVTVIEQPPAGYHDVTGIYNPSYP
jgi:hypothetical protein